MEIHAAGKPAAGTAQERSHVRGAPPWHLLLCADPPPRRGIFVYV